MDAHLLTAARHIYAKAGFTLTLSEKKKSFGKDVVNQNLGPEALASVSAHQAVAPHAVAPWALARRMFVESRHQLDEVAGPEPVVELVGEDPVPGVAAGAGEPGRRR